VEVSSFQLERVTDFRPRVGVLLNIQPDHLDRHGNMKTYVEVKARLFARMRKGDIPVVLDEIMESISGLSRVRNDWVSFGLSKEADYRYDNGSVRYQRALPCRRHSDSGMEEYDDSSGAVSLEGTIFANKIMGVTAAAAVAAMCACGLDSSVVEGAAGTFEPLPHRMREIAGINDVHFVDDSKATNLAALGAALEMCEYPVRLITGGLMKEEAKNLNAVKELLAKKVRRVYLIGKTASKMEKAWGDTVECRLAHHIGNAVQAAWQDAEAGDIVLLSPGCASFDQFRDFEDRGDQFTRIVTLIKEEEEK